MPIKKNRPKSAAEALNDGIVPLQPDTKPIIEHTRAEDVSMRGDDLRNYKIGLDDVDSSILYHISNKIKPIVMEDDSAVLVPVRYAYPEVWVSAQKDGGLRDKNGKMLFPVIAIKRDDVVYNKDIGHKIDGNNAHNYRVIEKQYSKKNMYDQFSVLTNRIPVKEFDVLPVPDYVIITYSCAVYVNTQRDLNSIIEAFMFASRSYWGDKEKNLFHVYIDNFPIVMEMNQGDTRKIYSIFTLNVNAHILPDTINRDMASAKKFISKGQVTFKTEISG